jgi:hypothetical protein
MRHVSMEPELTGPGTSDGPEPGRPPTLQEARALAHPVRLRILRLCLDEAQTNKELANARRRCFITSALSWPPVS